MSVYKCRYEIEEEPTIVDAASTESAALKFAQKLEAEGGDTDPDTPFDVVVESESGDRTVCTVVKRVHVEYEVSVKRAKGRR